MLNSSCYLGKLYINAASLLKHIQQVLIDSYKITLKLKTNRLPQIILK